MTPDEQFVAAAVRRIYRWMAACAVAGTLAVLVWKGAWHAGGFAAGAALSILNFHWLKAGVDALAAHFQGPGEQQGRPPARAGLVARFLLRYALIIAAGYAIFRSSALSLPAFLGGLLVFVAGVLAEMVYELATGTGAAPGTKT